MKEFLNKIKEWFKRKFKKNYILLDSGINEKQIFSHEFKEKMRIMENEEELLLIKKFEKGEITCKELTSDILNKIDNGYSLRINRNIQNISQIKAQPN